MRETGGDCAGKGQKAIGWELRVQKWRESCIGWLDHSMGHYVEIGCI